MPVLKKKGIHVYMIFKFLGTPFLFIGDRTEKIFPKTYMILTVSRYLCHKNSWRRSDANNNPNPHFLRLMI